ncbi:MAG: class IV adenylate cyclase [Asgard group archaeon]|nr:class IV adenylate cyclase [Asgard group archaeon]
MTIEVELKFPLDNPEEFESILIEKGAEFVEIVQQMDTYFNHPSRNYASTDEALRIRQDGEKIILTYKGPKIDPLSKSRVEEEVEFTNAENLTAILLQLGFTIIGKISKERKIYHLNDLVFCLDYFDTIGYFLEVEKVIPDKTKFDETRNEIIKLLSQWGINTKNNIRKSYLDLIMKIKK